MQYQIENTGTKLILVDPSLLDVALKAAAKASFPSSRIFLFSDDECDAVYGVKDWRTIVGSLQDSEEWKWKHLDEDASKSTVAVLNYSSGYFFFYYR